MSIQRKSAVTKAPTVAVLDSLAPPSAPTDSMPEEPIPSPDTAATTPQRGPGRPRTKRRMEQFATKIDIELRDRLDEYVAQHDGLTIVQFLDEAIRDRLEK